MDIKAMLTPELRLNPYPVYAMMRMNGGFLHLKEHQLLNVFRYADVRTVLSDHQRFSSQIAHTRQTEKPAFEVKGLIMTDPPRHTQLRSLVSQAFTPRSVSGLEPRIANLADEMLDAVIESGEIDLVADLAAPLPVMVIAELLGIPLEDRPQFRTWSDRVVASADAVLATPQGGSDDIAPVMRQMKAYFQQIIAKRREEPQDDLISRLLTAEVEGERLTDGEIFEFGWLLLVAGNETTTNLISSAVRTFLEHPDLLQRLTASPELLPRAIEEVLRYRSPVQAMFRVALCDVELAGKQIRAGERIIAWIGSANRDEGVFTEPDRFDIDRDPNPHLSFGHGIHFCLGAPLARMEARVVLQAVLRRLKSLDLVAEVPLRPVEGFMVHGLANLPLRFTPSARAVR